MPGLPSVTIQVASFSVELRGPEILLLDQPGKRYTTHARNNISRLVTHAAKQA
jgi:hypothetical protein